MRQDLAKGDRVQVRSYTEFGMAIVPGVITGFTESQVCIRADPEYPNAGKNGVVWAWYTDVLPNKSGS